MSRIRVRWIGRVMVSMTLLLCAIAVSAQGPQLSFRSVNGQTVNLTQEKGKVIVLSFSATWAPLASKELPAVQRLADSYPGRGVSIYWVSIDTAKQGARNYASDSDVAAFAAKYGLKVPVLRDPDQAAYKALGLNALPTIVVIDRTGAVAFKHVGFDPDQADPLGDVVRTVDGLLK
ncbi:MAG: TlpA disulfide reductase family protein [Acidobacteriota bacterium]